MRRSLLVLLVTLSVAVLGSTTATAAPRPDNVCEPSHTEEIVGVLPGDDTVEDTVNLYSGTRITLILCDGGVATTTDAWTLQAAGGLEDVQRSSKSYTATVSQGTSSIPVAELVEGQRDVTGLRITTQSGGAAETELTSESPLFFPSVGMREQFRQTENQYNRSENELEQNMTRLTEETERLENRNANVTDLEGDKTSDNIETEWGTLSNHTSDLKGLVYEATWRGRANSDKLEAIEDVSQRTEDTKSDARKALREYNKALGGVKQEMQTSVLLDAGLGLFFGLVIGTTAGAWYPHKKGKQVAYDRRYSNVEYSRRVLKGPVAAGLVIGIGVLALLVVTGWMGSVLEVLL